MTLPYLLRDKQTSAELLHWREQVTPPLAGVALIFCVIAQVLFYVFPRLRVFPRSILSWLNLYNIYYCVYAVWKWAPNTYWHASWASHINPQSVPCKIALLIDYSSLSGEAACTTLLCLTLFLVVVLKVDMERNPAYFWGYLAFVLLYPFGIGLGASLGFQANWVEGQSCTIANDMANSLIRSPYLALMCLQIALLGSTMFYIRKIFSAVTSSTQFPIKYLYIRFGATFLAQAFNLFPVMVFMIFPNAVNPHAILVRFCMATHAIGALPDALVMIFGNADFMDWARREIVVLRNKYGSWCRVPLKEHENETTETPEVVSPPKSKEMEESGPFVGEEVGIAMEEVHLSSSDSLSGHRSLSVVVCGQTSLEEQESSDIGLDAV